MEQIGYVIKNVNCEGSFRYVRKDDISDYGCFKQAKVYSSAITAKMETWSNTEVAVKVVKAISGQWKLYK